jgi:hypothetical protein
MANCHLCETETSLYVLDLPVCLECEVTIEQISQELRIADLDASALLDASVMEGAKACLNLVIHSGLPRLRSDPSYAWPRHC